MNFTLPKPMLGEITAITITSPDLEASLKFYQQLGFGEFLRADFPFPWIQITDGALLIMLRQDNKPYIALTYYVGNIDEPVSMLKLAGVTVTDMPTPGGMLKRYRILSPDGFNITLVQIAEGFVQPPGPTMLTMDQRDYNKPEKYVNKTCGMFGEYAQPVKDLDISVSFWQKLGFTILSRFTSPYPWAILSDGLAVVGLHQTNSFNNPVITYFASDMKQKIENLKEGGLNDFAENSAGSIVLTTPEKQSINLFSLGI